MRLETLFTKLIKIKAKHKIRTDNLLFMSRRLVIDIIPPKQDTERYIEKRKVETPQPRFALRKSSIFKIVTLLVIMTLGLGGLSAIIKTTAYYSNVEESKNNDFTAGILDFELSSTQVFSNMILSPGTSVTGTISVINLDNTPKYKVKADNFSGALCDYLNLEANLDGTTSEYSEKLKDFDYGPVVFESPDDWFFTLTLPADVATDTVIGETCNFNFVFYGSQIKNDLPFGQGFTDTEDATSNVKAKMCFDSEMKSCSYWKNHPNVYKPYLPQKLGNEVIDTVFKAGNILKAACGSCGCGGCDSTIRAELKGQLLAMKFNVAHFGIGDYIPTSTASSVSEIIAAADDLLKQNPPPDESILEAMKELLESIAQDSQIRVCTETGVKVLIPNGGEQWWVGMHYDLTWITKNLNCPNELAYITIWYSNDSGNTWANITISTEDDGVLNWRIPLFLEHNTYYVPSDKARIKVVAACSENMMVAGWDISDYDFCPPIDASLLTPEELELAIALGLIEAPPTPAESPATETVDEPATDTVTTTENIEPVENPQSITGTITSAPEATIEQPAAETTTSPEESIIIPTEPVVNPSEPIATSTDPTTTEPVIPQTEPTSTEPVITEPTTTEPMVTDPTTTEPAVPPEEPTIITTEPVAPAEDPVVPPETPSDSGTGDAPAPDGAGQAPASTETPTQ